MSFQSIGNLLPRSFKRIGLGGQLKASLICEGFNQIIKDFLPAVVTDSAVAAYFKDNTLFVRASNPIIAQEIKLKERMIIENINRKYQVDLILKFVA